jgi:hypothetical protein
MYVVIIVDVILIFIVSLDSGFQLYVCLVIVLVEESAFEIC